MPNLPEQVMPTLTRRRRLTTILGATSGVVALLLTLSSLLYLVHSRRMALDEANRGVVGALPLVAAKTSAPLRRPIFNYSVIPGGVWDKQEFQGAVEHDSVVALHYKTVNPATLREETITSDRMAYVSYRIGEQIFWTTRKVRLRSGETILTNGQTEIRARCGNCISLEPLLPTSSDEPDSLQLDALTNTGPVLVSWSWPTYGPLAAGIGVTDGDATDRPSAAPFIALFGLPVASRGDPFTDSSPTDSPASSTAEIFTPLPLAGGTFPLNGGDQLPSEEGETEFAVNAAPPLAGDGTFDASEIDERATVPATGTPVPEPATLVLLGSGIAGLLARHWRTKAFQ